MNTKCQVFTPENYVEKLLDSIGYRENIYGKTIMENSCGDGNILVSIVKRYIKDCKRKGLTRRRIRNGLERDIYGVEIDSKHYKRCLENLNEILKLEEIDAVNWKIFNENYLKMKLDIKFSYIVGNPPYITYSEIHREEREYVKENFITCQEGKFDYCYAFIEKSLLSLKRNGRMAYLIPSSIFKTVFGKNLRGKIKRYVTKIIDYTEEAVFDKALVKSAIMVLEKNSRRNNIIQYVNDINKHEILLHANTLEEKWFFTNNKNEGVKKFGDYFKVSHVVATLLNEAYVVKKWSETDDYIKVDDYCIEKEVIRETATPRIKKNNKKELIVFPYSYIDKRLVRYSVKEFENKFPFASVYLKRNEKKLRERKSDKSTSWFEYGRTQALADLDNEKLLISTVITKQVYVYKLNRECIPYAGLYIVPKTREMSLSKAKEILESGAFMDYVKDVGIHISGNSLRITSKDIMNFYFE